MSIIERRFIEDQAEESDGEGGVVESDDEELDDEEYAGIS